MRRRKDRGRVYPTGSFMHATPTPEFLPAQKCHIAEMTPGRKKVIHAAKTDRKASKAKQRRG